MQVPLHLRVAFGAFGSFCWMVALSVVSSSAKAKERALGEPVVCGGTPEERGAAQISRGSSNSGEN